ncbi:MAG TPA: carbonic anhydrase [Cytophagales bacterium]|nr:carbonic anhydrase [Cytophagales bacterium]HCR55314.1 carbonic anhydrase [Cytophagales bacterium]
MMPSYEQIFENNRKWIAEKTATNEEFFANLAKGQNPKYLYIGCSDSRATAEELMGAQPGEVFVHRNIANIISNVDLNAMSVIEYSVNHLHVEHIIVCGHYFCGGVKAAMQPQDLGILNPWLRNIRDVYRIHKEELNSIKDEEKKYMRLVELNVEEQCINVIKTAAVQKEYLSTGFPIVHGWVFNVKTGELIDLKINFTEKLKGIQEIYNLGTV